MAMNRESVIRAAEKYVSKGKLEHAIKEYRKVLAENPNDANTLNRVGDLYARIERFDEAVKLFSQIAEQYTRDGFFVKAIAIYKKIIKLDPSALTVYERLAELYYKQGLLNEARTQYQVLADYYQKHDNATSATTIYQKMSQMEPENPSFHLKLAELYTGQRLIDKAVREYRQLADILIVNGSVDEATQVYEKALEVDPENLDFVREAVAGLNDNGHVGAGAKVLAKAVSLNPAAREIAAQAGLGGEGSAAPEPSQEVSTEDEVFDIEVEDSDVSAFSDDPVAYVPGDKSPFGSDDTFDAPEASFGSDSAAGETSMGEVSFDSTPAEETGGMASFGGAAEEDDEVFTFDLDDDEIPDTQVMPPDDLDAGLVSLDETPDIELELDLGDGTELEDGGTEELDHPAADDDLGGEDEVYDLGAIELEEAPDGVEIDWSMDAIDDLAAGMSIDSADVQPVEVEELDLGGFGDMSFDAEDGGAVGDASAADGGVEDAGEETIVMTPRAEPVVEAFAPEDFEFDTGDGEISDDDTVAVDGALLETPEVSLEAPEVSLEAPEVSLEAPEVSLETPEVSLETPEVSLETPEVDLEAPEISFDDLEVDLDASDDTSDTPEVSLDDLEMSLDASEMVLDEPELGSDDSTIAIDPTTIAAELELEDAVEPEAAAEFDLESEISLEPELAVESELAVEPEIAVEPELEAEPELEPELEAEIEIAAEAEPELDEPVEPEDAPPAVRREEDLLAEAMVFAKYGLTAKAKDRLQDLHAIHPDYPGGLQLEIRMSLDTGDPAQTIELANRLSAVVQSSGDSEQWGDVRAELKNAGFGFQGDEVVHKPGQPKKPSGDRIAQLLEDLSLEDLGGPSRARKTKDAPVSPDVAAPAEIAAPAEVDTEDQTVTISRQDLAKALVPDELAEALDGAAVDEVEVAADPPAEVTSEAVSSDKKLFSLADELDLDELEDEFEDLAAAAQETEEVVDSAGPVVDPLDETGMSWLDDVATESPQVTEQVETIFDEEDDFFDLAAELERELSEEELAADDGIVVQPQEQSLEEIIDGFKQGVAENLSEEDYDTHYNLGIAYLEMGLTDEAIGEFQLACKDERYLVDCSAMLGQCFLEKGLPELAVRWYRKGLEAPNIEDGVSINLLYEMGNAYVSLGDQDAAYKTFVEIYGLNSNFRDVADKLQELQGSAPE